ncbi:MAG: hypothetical protein Q9208_005477 [Pyrenodesmia sp. 3 TL-2023]
MLSSRRHSRLTSGSTSSFFGNSNPDTLYPREFLEHPAVATAGKENEDRSGFGATGSQDLPPPGLLANLDEVVQGLKPDLAKQRHHTGSAHTGDSTTSTPATTRSSRSISERLANAPFFKLQSARHSISAAVPPIPPGYSPRSKDGESSVIKERRLMAPINPPLPRSTTMNVAPNSSFTRSNSYQASPRTPNFMRPTSSSAARRIESSRYYKPPPQPLNITSAGKTEIMGFGQWRSQKRLADAHANSAKPLAPTLTQRLRSGFYKGFGSQTDSYGQIGTTKDPGQLGQEQSRSQDIAYQSAVAATYDNVGYNAAVQAAANPTQLANSTSSRGRSSDANQLGSGENAVGFSYDLMPRGIARPSRIPRRPSSTLADLSTVRSSFGHSTSSNSSLANKPLPAVPTDPTAQPTFPTRKASLQPSSLALSHFSSALIDYDDASDETTTPLGHGNISYPSSSAHANLTAPVTEDPFADDDGEEEEEEEEKEEDPTLVSQEEGLIYWAGRFSGMNDHLRNESRALAQNEAARHKLAIERLQAKCTTRAAEESLARFVAASQGGWSDGPRGGGALVPRHAEPAPEPKKKGGLMGKMKGFGRKK